MNKSYYILSLKLSHLNIWKDIMMFKYPPHLIKVLGEQKVKMRERSQGVSRGKEYLGVVIGQIRRVLSCVFVRAQAL